MSRASTATAQPIHIHRVGVVSAIGNDFANFVAALRSGDGAATGDEPRRADIRPADHLGRAGLAQLDRLSQMAMVACLDALGQWDGPRDRTGIVLGTSGGSWDSITAFVKSTYDGPAPHMVSPIKFPNVVMNCAAAQSAIRFGLTGINSTVCAGDLSGLTALAYAVRALRLNYADRLLTGAFEEYCQHTAWSHAACAPDGGAMGEGVAVFALGREPAGALGSVLAVRHCRAGADDLGAARRAAAIRSVLTEAGVDASTVRWSMVSGDGRAAQAERDAIARAGVGAADALPPVAERRLGRTYAASFAFQLAAALAIAPAAIGLLTTADDTGQFGCALVRIAPAAAFPQASLAA